MFQKYSYTHHVEKARPCFLFLFVSLYIIIHVFQRVQTLYALDIPPAYPPLY